MDFDLNDEAYLADLHLWNIELSQSRTIYSHRDSDFDKYFDSMPDSNFKKRYRLSKNSITNLFYELNLEPKQRGNFIDPRIDVLCFLRYLCTGSFMEVSGDLLKNFKI